MRRRAGLLCLSFLVAAPAAAQNAVKEYERLIERYEASFKRVRANDSILAAHKAALRDLEVKLRAIVGPFPVAGFIQPGQMNNDDMFEGYEDFDQADGIRYQWRDSDAVRIFGSVTVVSTEPIIRAWLRRRVTIDSTLSLDAAFARQNALTWVFPMDAAAVPYAQIPRDTLRALGLSWGWIGALEQDDGIRASHAVFMVTRGEQVALVALDVQHPVPPSANCMAEWTTAGPVAFRACYAREVVRDPRFGGIVAQIREMTNRIRRQ